MDQPRLRVFERVDRTLTFLNCKRPILESVTPVIATYLRFDFKVTLAADEKEEELLPIVVNANARQADAEAIVGLRSAILGETLDLMAPVEPSCQVEDAYALACQEAEQHARAAAERHASRARFALLKELGRLHAFFDRNRADWEKQLTRLSTSGTAPPERMQAWEDRLRINEIERERRIQDIREKYRVSLRLQLVGAMRLLQPKVQVMIRVTDRKMERSVPVYYDPLCHRVEPLVCGGCRQWASRVTLIRDGRLLCEQCTAS
ncbi:MAG: hypothetical protein HY710_07745 [Candidatus Latescibacteria bacterium]|nr:hypothetical protein [Candidatus Latescibacterota bacterium]